MFLIISIIVLIISYYLMKLSAGELSIKVLNVHTFIFYLQFLLYSFIGVNLAVYYLDNHYVISTVVNRELRIDVLYSVLYTMIMLPLGMLYVNLISKFKAKKELNLFLNSNLEYVSKENRDKPILLIIKILVFVSLGALIYSAWSTGGLPLLEALKTRDSSQIARIRIEASRNFQGNSLIKNLLGTTLSTIVSYLLYVYAFFLKEKSTKKWFAFALLIAVLFQTFSLAKSPIIIYLLGFLLITMIINGKMRYKKVLPIVASLATLLLVLYIILGFNLNLALNDGPVGRLLLGQIAGLFIYFQIFPDLIPYLGLFSEGGESAARLAMTYFNPRAVELGVAGVMNTLFIGEAYAHFGVIGILLAPIFVGFIIQIVYVFFIRGEKNPFMVVMFVYFTIKLQESITGGLFSYFYNPNIIFTVIIFLLIITINPILKIFYRR